MNWAAFDVANDDDFLPDVRGLWERTYWPYAGPTPNDMFGHLQIVRFVGERVYYIREATYRLGKAGCWPKPFKTLTAAKATIEMMLATQGITR